MGVKQKNYPMICLPLTGKSKSEVMKELTVLQELSPDMIELRADFLEEIKDTRKIIDIVHAISKATEIPLLFTIRSEKEGGQVIPLSDLEIMELLCEVARSTSVAWIDYEVNNPRKLVQQFMDIAHENEKKVVLSYHNFSETPDNELLIGYFEKMDTYNADFAKIAVMPQSKTDVRRLLEVTALADEKISIPVITMSMGDLGKISRIIGWVYGSVLTFGVGIASSAPGQVPIAELREAIQSVQEVSGIQGLNA